jgi:hypothetical protein
MVATSEGSSRVVAGQRARPCAPPMRSRRVEISSRATTSNEAATTRLARRTRGPTWMGRASALFAEGADGPQLPSGLSRSHESVGIR